MTTGLIPSIYDTSANQSIFGQPDPIKPPFNTNFTDAGDQGLIS